MIMLTARMLVDIGATSSLLMVVLRESISLATTRRMQSGMRKTALAVSDSKLRDFDFTGGIIHSRMCYKTEFWHSLPITKHRGNTIEFRADMVGKLWKGPDACTKGYKMPQKFYIEALDALNGPNEWWFDRATQTVRVPAKGG